MIKPNMPNMPNFPGMGSVTDTLDFVKNLWGSMGVPGMNMSGMNIPGMVMPTLSVDEINKRITDMKAVESWLTLNMSMLRSTIQALEVQAATISTLQSMGETFSATMGAAAREPQPAPAAAPSFGATSGNGTEGAEKLHGAPQPTSKDELDAASLTAPLVNAAAWWNMLQDQFKQAVSGAMSAEAPTASFASEKPKAKTTAKTKTTTRAKPATTTASSTARKRKTAK